MTNQFRLHFNEAARSVFLDFEKTLQKMKISHAGLNNSVRKYNGLFVRLCIVHHMMRHVPNLTDTNATLESQIPELVDESTAQAVRALIDGFLLPHAKKVYGYFGEHPGRQTAEKIANWILERKVNEFKRRDVARFAPKQELKSLDAPLEYLEQTGWLRVDKTGAYFGRGGRPGEKLTVNPKVHELRA